MEEFEIVSLPKTGQPGSIESQDSGDFDIVSLPNQYEPEKGIGGSISRTLRGSGLRFAESALGALPDIASAASGLLNYATGGKTPTYEQAREKASILPPTSEQLREESRNAAHAPLTEPQNKFEEFFQDVASDVGSFVPTMLLFGGGKLPFSKVGSRIAQFAKGSGIGNSLKGIAKYFGAGEGLQSLAKIGGQIGYNLKGFKNSITDLKNSLYNEVRDEIKETATHPSGSFHKDALKIYDSVRRGASPDKTKISDVLKSALKKTEGRNANVREIWDLAKDINEHLADSNLSKRSEGVFKHLLGKSYEFLKDYDVNTFNKLERANAIQRGFKDVSKLGEYLNKHADLENLAKNPLTKAVVWGNLFKGKPGALAKGAATAGALSAARSAEEFRNILAKSPDAWKVLGNITQAALLDNTPNFIKGIHRLDRIFDRQEK